MPDRRLPRPLTVAILAAACALAPAPAVAAGEHPVQQALRARAAYARCRGRGTLRIDDPAGGFRLAVNVEVHADERGYLKIRATRAAFKAFTMLMDRSQVSFYLPREGKLYKGTPQEFAEQIGLFSPLEMLELLTKGHPEFAGLSWRVAGRSKAGGLVYESGRGAGGAFVRLEMMPDESLLRTVEYVLGDDRVVRIIRYEGYMDATVKGEKKKFPREIRVTWPEIDRRVTVRLRGIEEDPAVDGETWQVRVADKVAELPMAKLAMEGDKELPPEDEGADRDPPEEAAGRADQD